MLKLKEILGIDISYRILKSKTYKDFVMSIAQSVKHQDRLLTINMKDGEIKNALPGVHVSPCFLDPDNGVSDYSCPF